jgi:hypothetical protein
LSWIESIDRVGYRREEILLDPTGELEQEQHREAEEAMKRLAERGLVTLWRLIVQDTEEELMAAARPGLELDRDLEERGAWARAVRYETEE